ncbi:MAG: alpha/beta hydrolase [Planctomycetes bacterium]|nr:alpha/beta hydrolase [Planctomycetota bacterium]MCP4770933.1 alpha/beta hydrolase [Planctomycetota bacterium]MCP4861653.1 alpha/beta hydrolase [Planctomycetota bacterium]
MNPVPITPTQLTVNRERLPLALWDYGGNGPAVLFLHGFLDTGRSFEDAACALAADDICRPLCMDWRGHGSSGRISADAAYHQLDHLKDLAAVLDELQADGIEIAAVVAHSMGGTVALMLASFAPDMIQHLMLVDCVGGYAADASTQVDQMTALLEHNRRPTPPFRSFASREAAMERVIANNEGLSLAGAERIVRHYLDEQEDGRFMVRLDPRLRGPNPYRFPEHHWLEICGRVTAKVHLLAPEFGYIHRIPALQERFEKLPHATRQDLPGVGHHVHVEAVTSFADAVKNLLNAKA